MGTSFEVSLALFSYYSACREVCSWDVMMWGEEGETRNSKRPIIIHFFKVYYYPNHGCILDTWPQSG
jgi:hypothetical protein